MMAAETPDETTRTCIMCQGLTYPIVIMDKWARDRTQNLTYRQPDDTRSFWTGKYPTAGDVQAFLCGEGGRIDLYGRISAE